MPNHPIIPCSAADGWQEKVSDYAKALEEAAPDIGTHGMTKEDFIKSGLFKSAVERIRGQNAATMGEKRGFISDILSFMLSESLIQNWKSAGSSDRHDYEVVMPNGTIVCIEAKGCLDGNNTNIFKRPANADEFIIWSLCQNPGADPRKNAWSGIHTRLSAEIIDQRERVDGLIIWDMLCGTVARPCPKLESSPESATTVAGKKLPPPCMYLFPRSIPDARNNPAPKPWKLEDLHFMTAMSRAFKLDAGDEVRVYIEAKMEGSTVQRMTRYEVDGQELHHSKWTDIKRAR